MKSGLRTCKEHFYFFLGVPTGLSSIIQKPEILKSLHTNDRKTAHLLKGFSGNLPWHTRLSMVYYYLRSCRFSTERGLI